MGVKNAFFFLAGNRALLLGTVFLAGNRMTTVTFEKEVF